MLEQGKEAQGAGKALAQILAQSGQEVKDCRILCGCRPEKAVEWKRTVAKQIKRKRYFNLLVCYCQWAAFVASNINAKCSANMEFGFCVHGKSLLTVRVSDTAHPNISKNNSKWDGWVSWPYTKRQIAFIYSVEWWYLWMVAVDHWPIHNG